MSNKASSLLAIHLSVLLLGGTALFSKIIGVSLSTTIAFRAVFAFICLFLFLKMRGKNLALDYKKDYWIVAGLGLLLATHWLTYFHAMQVSTVAIGAIALYTYPMITVFIEPFFSKNKIRSIDVLCAGMVLVGVFFIVPEFSLGSDIMQGVLWGIFSALLFASRNVLHRHYFSHYSGDLGIFYQVFIVMLVCLPLIHWPEFSPSEKDWWLLILLGVVFTALPHVLFVFGLANIKAKSVSLIACLQVAYSAVFAAILIQEIPGWRTIVGGLIIIAVAAFESIKTSRTASENE